MQKEEERGERGRRGWCVPSVTLHPPGMAVPGVAGCGGGEGLVGDGEWVVPGGGEGGGRIATIFFLSTTNVLANKSLVYSIRM